MKKFESKIENKSEPEGLKPETTKEGPREKIWGKVTDPEKHDPKQFRYLIHAFNPFATVSQPLMAAEAELSGTYKRDKSQGDQSINLFDQPERLDERVSLSMSLIDQDHVGTWGNGGIIVEAPESNIAITSPGDTGAHSSSKEFLRKQAQDQPLLSGEQLLKSTHNEIYNEVVAFTKSNMNETVQLKGFFIKVDKRGDPIDPVIAKKMRQHAGRLNLSLIEIPVKGPYEQEMFETEENNAWAHYKGNRYNLGNDDPESAFNAYNDRYDVFFPSPQEIDEVLSHFVSSGDITNKRVQQIKEKYEVADKRRKSPKIEHDSKTKEIDRVVIKDGYGKDEFEYRLGSSGYCWRVNMEGYKRAFREMSFNPQRIRIDAHEHLRYQAPLSGVEVLSILESRKETLKKEEYKKLHRFFKGIRNKIDKAYNQQVSFR